MISTFIKSFILVSVISIGCCRMNFYEKSLIDSIDAQLKLNACNKGFKKITIDGAIRTPYLKDCTTYVV